MSKTQRVRGTRSAGVVKMQPPSKTAKEKANPGKVRGPHVVERTISGVPWGHMHLVARCIDGTIEERTLCGAWASPYEPLVVDTPRDDCPVCPREAAKTSARRAKMTATTAPSEAGSGEAEAPGSAEGEPIYEGRRPSEDGDGEQELEVEEPPQIADPF